MSVRAPSIETTLIKNDLHFLGLIMMQAREDNLRWTGFWQFLSGMKQRLERELAESEKKDSERCPI